MATIRISRNLGLLLAGVWLLLWGVFQLWPTLSSPALVTILAILAIVAGVLVMIEYKD